MGKEIYLYSKNISRLEEFMVCNKLNSFNDVIDMLFNQYEDMADTIDHLGAVASNEWRR